MAPRFEGDNLGVHIGPLGVCVYNPAEVVDSNLKETPFRHPHYTLPAKYTVHVMVGGQMLWQNGQAGEYDGRGKVSIELLR